MPERVAIVGAGLIGRAWAIAFARGGWSVVLWDADPAVPVRSLGQIRELLDDMAATDLLDGAATAELLERCTVAATLADALQGADWVQENAPERVELKRSLWAELDRLTQPSAILASSTSAIVASRFTEGLAHRERCLVVHPLNPPYLIPAVELVPAPWTAAATLTRAQVVMRGIGMAPFALTAEIEGFVMNRLQAALVEEAFKLVAAGLCAPEDIDIALRDGLALRWCFAGPFEVGDLNAPGGIRDYVTRYRSVFDGIRQSDLPRPDWTGPVLDEIEAARRLRLLASDLEARQRWRDRRLMALAHHKRTASREIGD